jgi:4'-phosphopantetheinyl transferase
MIHARLDTVRARAAVFHAMRELPEGCVHVWRVELDRAAVHADLWAVLGEEERRRAMRFRFVRDTERFVAAHAAVRTILARYLDDTDPAALSFDTGPFGKPALVGESVKQLHFSLSHSAGLALCAVARHDVGVDVERVRPEFAVEALADSYFSEYERKTLHDVSAGQRVAAFFACWTRKEAYIKARGEGFSRPLDSFDVTLAPGEEAALVGTRPDPDEARRWSLSSLDAGPRYAAAVAVETDLTSFDYLAMDHSE